MPVRATKLQSSVISTKRDWPRTVFALTQGDGNVVPQVLTLVQLSPRENYKLWGSAPLQPGTNFPSFPVPRERNRTRARRRQHRAWRTAATRPWASWLKC